ncbi:MAG: VWA domain-containing protein [Bacteroidales bacterium]|nr:VWA domain-containing protein [Bacteroidales bacterium]
MEFANIGFLYLLFGLIPFVAWYIWKNRSIDSDVQLASLQAFKNTKTSYKVYLKHFLFGTRMLAISLIIIVLARPQSTDQWKNVSTEGIDIVLALDISSSMLAQDLKPDRLKAAVNVAEDFIKERINDRIGLVVFAGESFTQCPITSDHDVLINLLKNVKTGMIEDGTAIGMGLANAVNRLKESEAKSKIVILLTDGENNKGDISPLTAAEIASNFQIRVYTVGVGTRGQAPYPVQTLFGTQTQMMDVNIDEPTLKEISKITDGAYFRATDNQSLKDIYKEIEQLEKTKINVNEFSSKNEEFFIYALIAGLLLLFEFVARQTILKSMS